MISARYTANPLALPFRTHTPAGAPPPTPARRSPAATRFSLNLAINRITSVLTAEAAGPHGVQAMACSILTDLYLSTGVPIPDGTDSLTARELINFISSSPGPQTPPHPCVDGIFWLRAAPGVLRSHGAVPLPHHHRGFYLRIKFNR